jgi:hypothetical protein
VLQAEPVLNAQLVRGSFEADDGAAVAERVVNPTEACRQGFDVNLRRYKALIVALVRSEHHAMLTE